MTGNVGGLYKQLSFWQAILKQESVTFETGKIEKF